jgi:hypothetical protein
LDLQVLGFAVNDHEQVFVLQVLRLLVQLVLELQQLVQVLQPVLVLQLVQVQQLLVLVEFHHVVHLQLEH